MDKSPTNIENPPQKVQVVSSEVVGVREEEPHQGHTKGLSGEKRRGPNPFPALTTSSDKVTLKMGLP